MSLSLEALRRGMGGWETFKLQYMHMMKTTIVHVYLHYPKTMRNSTGEFLVAFPMLRPVRLSSIRRLSFILGSSCTILLSTLYAPVLHHRRWL